MNWGHFLESLAVSNNLHVATISGWKQANFLNIKGVTPQCKVSSIVIGFYDFLPPGGGACEFTSVQFSSTFSFEISSYFSLNLVSSWTQSFHLLRWASAILWLCYLTKDISWKLADGFISSSCIHLLYIPVMSPLDISHCCASSISLCICFEWVFVVTWCHFCWHIKLHH